MEDGLQYSMQKKNSKIMKSNKHQQNSSSEVLDNQAKINEKLSIPKEKNIESNSSVNEKIKTKRLSKIQNSDNKQLESNLRYSKKLKKDS